MRDVYVFIWFSPCDFCRAPMLHMFAPWKQNVIGLWKTLMKRNSSAHGGNLLFDENGHHILRMGASHMRSGMSLLEADHGHVWENLLK